MDKAPAHRLVLRRRRLSLQYYTEELGDGVVLKLRPIPAGTFLMGPLPDELDSYRNEHPRHEVTLQSFFLGMYPVTQAQWRVVASQYGQVEIDLNPDPANGKGDNRPVERVSWDEAVEFCRRLSRRSGKDYRLPSEAQWEYACRAGTTTPFYFGETIDSSLANYRAQDWEFEGQIYPGVYGRGSYGEFREETTDVGSFPPNRFGLYDTHGSVVEWCEDDYHDSYEGAPDDGSAWVEEDRSGTRRSLRGGSWNFPPRFCRSAVRSDRHHARRNAKVGFRVCCVPPRAL